MKQKTPHIINLLLLALFPTVGFSQTSVVGKYADTTCFRISECFITNLTLKNDSSYILTYVFINHEKKHKVSEKGYWTFKHAILKLNPKDLKKSKLDAEIPRIFKFHNNNLWYTSDTTSELTDIALKKNHTDVNEIKIIAMNSRETNNPPDTLNEAIVKLKNHPSCIKSIHRKDIKMLKKMAKENGANSISVDLERKWTKTVSFEKDDYFILFLNTK